ncbi:hypothetical protein ACRRTK_019294 [Alexandromys fortis]
MCLFGDRVNGTTCDHIMVTMYNDIWTHVDKSIENRMDILRAGNLVKEEYGFMQLQPQKCRGLRKISIWGETLGDWSRGFSEGNYQSCRKTAEDWSSTVCDAAFILSNDEEVNFEKGDVMDAIEKPEK